MKNIGEAFTNFVDNITGKNKTPGEKYEEKMGRTQARIDSRIAAKDKRMRQISECAAVLRECRDSFKKTIAVENALAASMHRDGFETNKQEIRVREAAVGILVVNQALYELQSISSESDLNSAMNKMGMALRQLRRIDNSSSAISPSTERILNTWCPDMLQNITDQGASQLEVPDAIRDKIDSTFLANLMAGDPFDVCLYKSNMRQTQTDTARSTADDYVAQIEKAAARNRTANTVENEEDIDKFRHMF